MSPLSEKSTQRSTWFVRGAIVLCLLWISAEVRLWQLRHRMENLWVNKIFLRVVDAKTGAVISSAIGTPGDSGDHLPICLSQDVTREFRQYTIISDKPVFFHVLSEGYADQWLQVDNSSSTDITVKLSKN